MNAKRARSSAERSAQIMEMRRAGLTFRECGAELGITGERAAQILRKLGVDPGVDAKRQRAAQAEALRAEKKVRLEAIKERRRHEKKCCMCKQVKPLSEFCKDSGLPDGRGARCAICNRKYVLSRYKDPSTGYAEKQKAWARANPEKRREYVRRYQEKKKLAKMNAEAQA